MEDTIYRQQAIDALKKQAETMSEWSNRYAEQRKGVLTAVNIVEDLPSAQFATDINVGDTIYRQQAIDEVINLWADKPFGNPTLVEIKGCIEALPSAQPEIIRCKDCKHQILG